MLPTVVVRQDFLLTRLTARPACQDNNDILGMGEKNLMMNESWFLSDAELKYNFQKVFGRQ